MLRKFFGVLALMAVVCMFAPFAAAQENANITGTVTDPTGAVIPNAAVLLVNTATGHQQSSVANTAGIYLFGNLGVGTYSLSVNAKGFQKTTIGNITVNAGQTVTENVKLSVGSASQTIRVQAGALHLQTQTNELSTLMTGKQVAKLATNGRNVTALAALGLGVSNRLPAFSGVDALTSSNGISFNGTRSSHNIYMLDGGELNDRGCGGCFSSLPSIDALSEFRTLDSNFPPYYGLGSGGVIMMVIKSGTRKFHGELYEFNRNEAYDANNYFTNLAGQKRPEFRLNEPGGNIGGPLFIPHVYNVNKKRTFFFVNEEWRRLIQGSTPRIVNTIPANNFPTLGQDLLYNASSGSAPIVPDVPNNSSYTTTELNNGLTPGQPFPTNSAGQYVIPASMIDQNSVLELNAGTFPKPNYGTNQYISSIPTRTNVREDVVRIDHSINSKLQLMGHYLHDATKKTFYPPLWGDSTYPTVGTQMKDPSYSAVISLTQTISPNLLNVTSYDYSGNKIFLDPIAGPTGGSFVIPSGWSATSFFPLANNDGKRLPEIDLQGAPLSANWSSSYYPWKNGFEGFEWRDDLSWTKGRHSLRFGFSWFHYYKNQQLQANTQGTAAFNNSAFSKNSYINFLLGLASNFTQLQYLAGKHWVSNNYSLYANDDWHISRNLTINLGLRYDIMPHTFERYNKFANFVPADYNQSAPYPLNSDGTLNPSALTSYNNESFYLNGIKEAGANGFPKGVVKNDFKTVEPRLGFAYDWPGNGKTVVRGGFGLFYERIQGNDVYNAALNPPFAYQPSATNVYFSNPHTSALTGQSTTQSFPSVLTNIKYHYPHPGTAEYSLGVQRRLSQSVIAVVQYAGSNGWDQNDTRAINTLPLTDTNNAANPYDLREGVANGSLNANLYRFFPGYSSITQEENETNFTYNALEMGLRATNWHNLTVQVAYTYSHEIDEISGDLGRLSNPFNPKYDRGSGSFDRRHILNLSYIYAFPFFQHSQNLAERTVLAGWEFSGITTAESGTPQYINYTGPDTLGLGGGVSNRPNLNGKVSYIKNGLKWFSPSSFSDPVAPWNGGKNQGWGNAGKDAVVLPGLLNFNWSLFKTIHFTQNSLPSLELRFEAFNIFNHVNFTGVDANSGDGNFGQLTSAYGARSLQLGAKLHF